MTSFLFFCFSFSFLLQGEVDELDSHLTRGREGGTGGELNPIRNRTEYTRESKIWQLRPLQEYPERRTCV
jgi:hypothetical protein